MDSYRLAQISIYTVHMSNATTHLVRIIIFLFYFPTYMLTYFAFIMQSHQITAS